MHISMKLAVNFRGKSRINGENVEISSICENGGRFGTVLAINKDESRM